MDGCITRNKYRALAQICEAELPQNAVTEPAGTAIAEKPGTGIANLLLAAMGGNTDSRIAGLGTFYDCIQSS